MRKWVWNLLLLKLSTLNIKSIFSLRASFANKPCLSHSVEMPSFEVWASTCENSLFTEKLGTVLQCEYKLKKIYINQILLYNYQFSISNRYLYRCKNERLKTSIISCFHKKMFIHDNIWVSISVECVFTTLMLNKCESQI